MIVDYKKCNLDDRFVRWMFCLTAALLIPMHCASPEPLAATITELSACKGWNEAREPVGISKTFSASDKYIFACGYLRVNRQSIALAVNWYYEDKLIFRDIIRDAKGYFYSRIEPTGETFSEGIYRIEVVIGKTPVQSVEFRIE